MLSCLDDAPVLDEKGIQLALWMRERYFCTVSDAVKAMLPAGDVLCPCETVTLVLKQGWTGTAWDLLRPEAPLPPGWRRCSAAGGGGGHGLRSTLAFGAKDPTPAIRVLLDRKIAVLETSAQRGVGDKTERVAVLEYAGRGGHRAGRPRPDGSELPLRYAVTELLCTLGAASTKELCYFTGASPPRCDLWKRAESSPWRSMRCSGGSGRGRGARRTGGIKSGAGGGLPTAWTGSASGGKGGRRPAVRGHGQRQNPGVYPPDPGGAGRGGRPPWCWCPR